MDKLAPSLGASGLLREPRGRSGAGWWECREVSMEEMVVLLGSEGGALGLQEVGIAFQAEEMA